MHCATQFFYNFDKTGPETFKLMKDAYKEKCFNESTIFRWHSNFKKGRLSAKLAPKSTRPKNNVDDRNVNSVWAILQDNR